MHDIEIEPLLVAAAAQRGLETGVRNMLYFISTETSSIISKTATVPLAFDDERQLEFLSSLGALSTVH